MNEGCISDTDFSFEDKLPVISDKEDYSRPLFLSLLLRFLHRLRERKNLTRMFQQMVRHNHIGYGGRAYILCGVLQEVPMSHKFVTLIRTT